MASGAGSSGSSWFAVRFGRATGETSCEGVSGRCTKQANNCRKTNNYLAFREHVRDCHSCFCLDCGAVLPPLADAASVATPGCTSTTFKFSRSSRITSGSIPACIENWRIVRSRLCREIGVLLNQDEEARLRVWFSIKTVYSYTYHDSLVPSALISVWGGIWSSVRASLFHGY